MDSFYIVLRNIYFFSFVVFYHMQKKERKSVHVTDWSCWMMSSSSLRYLSLSSSTRRRCLCRGSSCFLRASATRTFSSASVRFNRVRTESWLSICTHTFRHNVTYIALMSAGHVVHSSYLEMNCINVSLAALMRVACWSCEMCYCCHNNWTRKRNVSAKGFSNKTLVIDSNFCPVLEMAGCGLLLCQKNTLLYPWLPVCFQSLLVS